MPESSTATHVAESNEQTIAPFVVVESLRKTYGATVAVDDVSLSVRPGEIFGILGPNGAGKTTTVESIAGLRRPDGGTVRVLGIDPAKDRAELTKVVGVQLQASELPEKIRVGEAIELYSSFYDKPADTDELLELLGLGEKRDVAFGKLSGGQRQRLSIALALVGRPRIAILDELTTGLDPQARRDTWALVRKIRDRGVTVILVTHFMEEAEQLCDRIAIIDRGRVVATDTPAGLIAAVRAEHRVTFRTAAPFDDTLLTGLDPVSAVTHEGERVVVSGDEEMLVAVVTTLAAHRIAPLDLRTSQASLDDAFLAFTGRSFDSTADGSHS